MEFTASQIARVTGGILLGDDTTVHGATIDSRRVEPGQLFVPVVAERDGHAFIDAALAAGAATYLSARDDDTGRSAIRVDDTSVALSDLGRAARERVGDQVVGVTGSVGKTSTKDFLAAVLRTTYRTAASRASFNNELGVPLTLLNAADDTEAIVCEMGARGIGHIRALCGVARPTIGVVTAIAGAHLEMFGSLEQVALAKGELVEALPASGTAVLNADYELVDQLANRTSANVVRYGMDRIDVDLRATSIEIDTQLRPSFMLHTPDGTSLARLAAHGSHQVSNALAATAAALVMGVELDVIVAALESAELSPMRMDVRRRADGLVVIDDSYNANPTSTAAALHALRSLEAERRIAVLGEMAELGRDGDEEHRAIARLANDLEIAVIAVGTTRYGSSAHTVGSIGEALILLGGQDLGANDAVLVKGSRVTGLDALARRLC